ncbi:hypothetical protein E2320_013805 [Naja naja]|nr:hypothetical protein E2320_013805 [Naja naja]
MVKLFIGNLPREATEQEIRSLFEQYGRVLECDIIKNYGFVHIEDKTAAEDAIRNLHHYKLHGVCINVEASKNKSKASTKLHVGNISTSCTNLELRSKFEEYGPVLECDIVKDYAFVHMERAEDAVEAIRGLDNTEFQAPATMVKLFIGNLPREATEQEIRSLFEQYGRVLECDIIKNYGFVHIEDKTAAEDAIRNLHHYKLHGVCINVEASKNKSKASTKLHVGNISTSCTNLELRSKFEEYGPVLECDIVKDYAFVHMERAEDAVEAIRGLDNTEFQGRLFEGWTSGSCGAFTSKLCQASRSVDFVCSMVSLMDNLKQHVPLPPTPQALLERGEGRAVGIGERRLLITGLVPLALVELSLTSSIDRGTPRINKRQIRGLPRLALGHSILPFLLPCVGSILELNNSSSFFFYYEKTLSYLVAACVWTVESFPFAMDIINL